MLNQSRLLSNHNSEDLDGFQPTFKNSFSIADVLAAAKRQVWVVVISGAVAGILGALYIIQAKPTYTSSASLLIDAKNVGMTAATPLEGSLTFDSGAIDSQLQILNSDKLAASVATRLGLQDNFSFIDPEPSLLGGVVRKLSAALREIAYLPPQLNIRTLPQDMRVVIATNILEANLTSQRVGRSFVFLINYTNGDAGLAQAIAAQFANAYLEDQLDSKFDATRRATNWMEERIRDLKARSLAADEAVQKYRAENGLVAASGRLVDEQALTDATTQLTNAQTALDSSSARYQRLKQIVDAQDVTGSLSESLENPNVAALRSRYLQAAKLESEITARYGPNHMAAEKARKDMAEYTRLIFAELTNLLPSYQSDVAISQARVNSIQNTIAQLRKTSSTNDSAMVKLRSLDQEADTLRNLYSSFLQKSQELQQQQSFPVTDARVISEASMPYSPTSPKKLLIFVASIIYGLFVGAGIGWLREWRDRGFRTASQVRDEIGLEFMANIPSLDKVAILQSAKKVPAISQSAAAGGVYERVTLNRNPVLQAVVNDPFSQFSEAIRTLRSKISLEFSRKKGIVIGIISIYPDEGKSTVSKNLASSIALQGTRTILIDGDVRNPSLTNNLSNNNRVGLVDVIQGRAAVADILYHESGSGLAFLPTAARARAANDVFGSNQAHDLIDELRRQYDVVVIDFPPVGALTDAMEANSVIDGYVFVTQWGKTPRKVLREFVTNHPHIADKALGVVLNKVDLQRLGKYGAYHSGHQYKKYINKYFQES